MKYKIRTAVPTDEGKIRELFLEMLRTIYHTDDVKGYGDGDLDRFWSESPDRIYVAEDGQVVAFLSVEVHHDPVDHIYRPSADDILYHLEQTEPERYNLNLGWIMNNEGEPVDEFGDEFIRYDTDPFSADLPDDICALREIADSLTGRLRAVYEAMLQRAADGAGRMTLTDVQHEWNVSYTQIMKDTKKIEKMIRERIGKPH